MFTRYQTALIPAPSDPVKDAALYRDLYYIQHQLYIQNDLVQALVRVRGDSNNPAFANAIAKITQVKFPAAPMITDDLSLKALKYEFAIEMSLSAEIVLPVIREFLYPSNVDPLAASADWKPEEGKSVGTPIDINRFWIRRGNDLSQLVVENADLWEIGIRDKKKDDWFLSDEETDVIEANHPVAKLEGTPPVDVSLICRFVMVIPDTRPLWITPDDWKNYCAPESIGKGSIRGGD
jgi:hypothetical protein